MWGPGLQGYLWEGKQVLQEDNTLLTIIFGDLQHREYWEVSLHQPFRPPSGAPCLQDRMYIFLDLPSNCSLPLFLALGFLVIRPRPKAKKDNVSVSQ